MYRREFLILLAFGFFTFCFVALGTSLLVNHLNAQVISIARGTIPDLTNISALRSLILENWNRVFLIQASTSAGERSRLIQEIEENSSLPLLKAFQATPNSSQQETHLNRLEIARSHFLKIRNDYFNTVQSGDMKRSTVFMESQLKPAYGVYREETETLAKLTADEGYARAQDVVRETHFSVLVAGALAAFAFLTGVLVGFRILFQGLTFANRFGQLPSPVERKGR